MFESEKNMQNSLITLIKIYQKYKTKIKANKIKTMMVTKAIPLVKLEIDNNLIEYVKQFKYLGSTLTSDGRCSADII